MASSEETEIMYHKDDEDNPYLIKLSVADDKVTLNDFKTALNRPNYKFFFRPMDDDSGVVKEELIDDEAKLPCFNGRVVSWLVTAESGSHSSDTSTVGVGSGGAISKMGGGSDGGANSKERVGEMGDSRPPSFHPAASTITDHDNTYDFPRTDSGSHLVSRRPSDGARGPDRIQPPKYPGSVHAMYRQGGHETYEAASSVMTSTDLDFVSNLTSQRTSEQQEKEASSSEDDGYSPHLIGKKRNSFVERSSASANKSKETLKKEEKKLSDDDVILVEKGMENIDLKLKRCKRRLFVGEADFSYTVALLKKHEEKHPQLSMAIIATEYSTKRNLETLYPDTFPNNLAYLEKNRVFYQFGIDAANIYETYGEIFPRIPRIHFNFPHDGKNYKDINGKAIEDLPLPKMIRNFFESASRLQQARDRIHVALPKDNVEWREVFRIGYIYRIEDARKNAGYKLIKKRKFDDVRYPGYDHRKTTSNKGVSVAKESGREYIFEKGIFPDNIKSETSPKKEVVVHIERNLLSPMSTDDDSSSYEEDISFVETVPSTPRGNNSSLDEAESTLCSGVDKLTFE